MGRTEVFLRKASKASLLGAGLFASAALWLSPAQADPFELIDPNFSVCAFGTLDVTSCGPTDPQRVTSLGVSVGVIGNAGAGPLSPFLILAAVPDLPTPKYPGAPAPAPTWGSPTGGYSIAAATSAQYGQTNAPSATGYLGELTSSSPDLYTFAGLLAQSNNSFNFPNMSGFSGELALHGGVMPTSFSIYEFLVTVTNASLFSSGDNLDTGNVYNLPFSSVTAGTYIAAWGIDKNPPSGHTFVYDSAFTVAGFVGDTKLPPLQLPEPGSLVLVGLGLGLAAYIRRRLH
jgi:hypothetical protein